MTPSDAAAQDAHGATAPTAFTNDGGILNPAVAEYVDQLNWPDDDLLQEMYEHGRRDGIPIVSTTTGRLLELLVRLHEPRLVVEFGTAIGYSTLFMARAMRPMAVLRSWEIDPERHQQAKDYLARATDDIECTLDLRLQDAIEGIRAMNAGIELAFLDATKGEYQTYLDLVLERMSSGGIVVVDNALMSGAVATGEGTAQWEQSAVDAQREFNAALVADPRMRAAMVLPVGDGVAIALRR